MMVMGAVDMSDVLAKLLENSTLGACLLFVFYFSLRYLTRRDDLHNKVITEIVERMDRRDAQIQEQMDRRDEQIQQTIDCLREAVDDMSQAVDLHRARTENGKHGA